MSKTERLYKLEHLIAQRGPIGMTALLAELEVSRATLKRDLEYLRSRLDAPIEYDALANGYRYAQDSRAPRRQLPGLWFDQRELYALLMAHQLLSGIDADGTLARHLQPLLERIRQMLGGQDAIGGTELLDRVRIVGAATRPVDGRAFELLAQALLQRTRVHLRYLTRGRGSTSERDVSPQRLVHYRSTWYLDAWCHRVHALRRFALDAVQAATALDTRARDVPLADVQAAMDAGYGIWAGGADTGSRQWATLIFTPQAARWTSRELWHPEQQGRFRDDGCWELRLPYVDDTELVMDVLRQGDEVEVAAPPALREKVAARLAAAAAVYRAT